MINVFSPIIASRALAGKHLGRLDSSHTTQDIFINKKVVFTGHLVEIYDFQFSREVKNTYKKTSRKRLQSEYLKTSNSSSYNRCRSISLGNFSSSNSFLLTLTFHRDYKPDFLRKTKKIDLFELKATNRKKDMFIKKLNKFYGNPKYLIVPELHKSGQIHYHALVELPRRLNDKERAVLWPYGFSNMTKIRDTAGLLYISKYVSKTFGSGIFRGRRKFFSSLNCVKPTALSPLEGDVVAHFFSGSEGHFSPLMTRSYPSLFNGVVLYRAWIVSPNWQNLIRGRPMSFKN